MPESLQLLALINPHMGEKWLIRKHHNPLLSPPDFIVDSAEDICTHKADSCVRMSY